MKKRLASLKGDPLPWLLEPENPSVCYWTLIDILCRPAANVAYEECREHMRRKDDRVAVEKLIARKEQKGPAT